MDAAKRSLSPMRGLYAIVDVGALAERGLDPVAFAACVLEARPAALQLRAKDAGARRTLELLRALSALATRAGVPLFANDRPDLALLAGCDGVHLGQDDVPVALARGISLSLGRAPLWVGVSTHDAAQVEAALADEGSPDYIAIGPIFPTMNKENPDPVLGLDRLAALASRIRAHAAPRLVVAIGGISLENAPAIAAVADACAVIGALLPPAGSHDLAGVTGRARALHVALGGAGS